MHGNDECKIEMIRVMENYQFVEETLKMWFLAAIDIAKHMTRNHFPLNL